ncbi:sensor histidine kinase [Flavobacterium sp. N1994]|uniref:sensor histidine kinase n=1 Tax=Flavobacterium sp. N1994 TaxID=2986827 RepID=UPI00222217CA|nr:HAMP domain-containing sensor histidine kinase [Flavobacterium sp. N1994]
MEKTNSCIAPAKELDLVEKLTTCRELNSRLLNLFYTMSHNLNAHTGNIKLLLDIIDFEDDPTETKEALGHLRTVSDNLNNTIADLFKIVSVESNKNIAKESLNLNQYIDKVSQIISGYKNENHITFINKVPTNAYVNFNSAYLESVLLNFATNAIKYAHQDRLPQVEFDFYLENEYQVLAIKDNGIGIDLERHGNALFGLYKTFHKHENANGFGLYISKYQIEAMNGKVTVDSEVGVGTTFKIYFRD